MTTKNDTDRVIREMMDWLDEQGVYSFAALADYASQKKPDWFSVVLSPAPCQFLVEYCNSRLEERLKKNDY